jgi:hypothetical protein
VPLSPRRRGCGSRCRGPGCRAHTRPASCSPPTQFHRPRCR